MNGEELYDIYRGYAYIYSGCVGKICGYGIESYANYLVGRNNDPRQGWKLDSKSVMNLIIADEGTTAGGFYWVRESELLKTIPPANMKPLIISDIADKYISTNFPNITEDEKDIYINIFLEGTKYKEK